MKTQAYALAAAAVLLALTAPSVSADDNCPLGICPPDADDLPDYPRCTVFGYRINPFGYTLHPECLYP